MLWLVTAAAGAKAWKGRVGHNQRLPGPDMAPDLFPEGLLQHPYCVPSLSASAGALAGPRDELLRADPREGRDLKSVWDKLGSNSHSL